MAGAGLKVVSEENFQEAIKKGLVLVDFYADWCGPCRTLTPVLERIAGELQGKASIVKIDVDSAQKVASTFGITSIPTLILFNDGQEVDRVVGLQSGDALKKLILAGVK